MSNVFDGRGSHQLLLININSVSKLITSHNLCVSGFSIHNIFQNSYFQS